MAAKSPAVVTPKRPVLSVSARKIKDNAADWHNLMMKWESLNDKGFTAANKIVNLKISAQFKDNRLEIECENPTQDSGKLSPHYNEELEMYCTELLEILENMTKIQLKMEKLTSTTKGVCDLETYHSRDGRCKAPLFHTWPTSYFYETSFKLSEMYKEELQLKQTIVQEIAHTADEDLMMVYLSSWLYQPYIESSSKLLLESMLLETGHRPI
ncbi:cyclin-dependent kinase 2-interacting protein [Alligator mississippiensis]|uniref:Cyclin-dependent kinase 2-interacting protein n=1 Tax=Alligator mississippiensis TaxID=8496 RepID=A0A151P8V1_ALLMI|nr:cyclin-dependent kinase 2-interacting protein [Alligator mississippiensis]KYO45400.1 cyclin-dependent kinase 2-interacting protein [Alligator mississippiensis]